MKKNWIPALLLLFVLPGIYVQAALAFAQFDVFVTKGTNDDTFLYLQVARNWSKLGFPTFDGLSITNGFQPLWMLFLYGLTLLIEDPQVLLRSVFLLAAAFSLLTLYPLYKIGSELGGKILALGAILIWGIYLLSSNMISGMDDSLHGFLFSVLALVSIRLWQIPKDWKASQMLLLGALLALTGLCRLDSGIICLLIVLPFTWKCLNARRWDLAASLLIIPLLSVSILFSVNLLVFEALTPISGLAKMFWAQHNNSFGDSYLRNTISSSVDVIRQLLTVRRSDVLLFGIFSLLGILLIELPTKRKLEFLVLSGFVAVHTALLQPLLQQFARSSLWYYAPERVIVALMGGFALCGIHTFVLRWQSKKLNVLAVCSGLLLFVCFAVNKTPPLGEHEKQAGNHFYLYRVAAGHWLQENKALLREGRVGSWNAGQLSFFSYPTSIVNLDGLVQSPLFVSQVLQEQKWRNYFRCNEINYLLDYNCKDATQAYGATCKDPETFRNLVPFSEATIVKTFGSDKSRNQIILLDISPWLEGDNGSCNEMTFYSGS